MCQALPCTGRMEFHPSGLAECSDFLCADHGQPAGFELCQLNRTASSVAGAEDNPSEADFTKAVPRPAMRAEVPTLCASRSQLAPPQTMPRNLPPRLAYATETVLDHSRSPPSTSHTTEKTVGFCNAIGTTRAAPVFRPTNITSLGAMYRPNLCRMPTRPSRSSSARHSTDVQLD